MLWTVWAAGALAAIAGHAISLSPAGVSESGIFDEGAAESVVHDPATQRPFVINANAPTADVLDVSDPASPVLFQSLDVKPCGAAANWKSSRPRRARVTPK